MIRLHYTGRYFFSHRGTRSVPPTREEARWPAPRSCSCPQELLPRCCLPPSAVLAPPVGGARSVSCWFRWRRKACSWRCTEQPWHAIIAKLDNSIAGLQPTKRKTPPAGGQSGPPASRQWASTITTSTQPPAPPQNSPFQQELLAWGTWHSACHAHWKGQQCRRPHCALTHTQVHPNIYRNLSLIHI